MARRNWKLLEENPGRGRGEAAAYVEKHGIGKGQGRND